MSGDEFDEGRVQISALFKTTKFLASISSAIESPRVSLFPNDHNSLWALMSPTTTVLSFRSVAMEAEKFAGQEDCGGTYRFATVISSSANFTVTMMA